MKALAIGTLLLVVASAAAAQNICSNRAELVTRLWNKWEERQVARGLVNDNRLIEVFAATDGSWTILITDISGKSCVASAGRNWTDDGFDKPGKDTSLRLKK